MAIHNKNSQCILFFNFWKNAHLKESVIMLLSFYIGNSTTWEYKEALK